MYMAEYISLHKKSNNFRLPLKMKGVLASKIASKITNEMLLQNDTVEQQEVEAVHPSEIYCTCENTSIQLENFWRGNKTDIDILMGQNYFLLNHRTDTVIEKFSNLLGNYQSLSLSLNLSELSLAKYGQ